MLSLLALVVMNLLIVVAIVAAVLLGGLPGRIAQRREHPQADAIRVCGWMGLLTLGVLWPVAMVWAYLPPSEPTR